MERNRSDASSISAGTISPQKWPSDSLAAAISAQYNPLLERLIPYATGQQLEILTRHLPQAITSLWGYELPLDKQEASSDFLLCLHKADVCNLAFQTHAGLREVVTEPLYSRLSNLIGQWADLNDRVGQVMSNIWLEYDYKGLQPGQLRPSFFFGPKSNCHLLEVVWAARQIFDQLAPEGLPKDTYRFMVRCMSLLGPKAGVSQIGRMLARQENSLRLFIQQLPAHGILPYLRRMGYQHADNPLLAAQLKRCYTFADAVDLDIDITDRIGSQLGLECYFDTTEKALLFLKDLVGRGLCLPEKYQVLHSHLLQLRPTTDEPLVHFFSHVKLGFHPDKGFTSKVYIGYVDRPIASSVVRTKPTHTP